MILRKSKYTHGTCAVKPAQRDPEGIT